MPEYNYDDVRDLVEFCRPRVRGSTKYRVNAESSTPCNFGHTSLNSELSYGSTGKRYSQVQYSTSHSPTSAYPELLGNSLDPSNHEVLSHRQSATAMEIFASPISDQGLGDTNTDQRMGPTSSVPSGEREDPENEASRPDEVQAGIEDSLSVQNSHQRNARRLSPESRSEDETNQPLRSLSPLSDSGTPVATNVDPANTMAAKQRAIAIDVSLLLQSKCNGT